MPKCVCRGSWHVIQAPDAPCATQGSAAAAHIFDRVSTHRRRPRAQQLMAEVNLQYPFGHFQKMNKTCGVISVLALMLTSSTYGVESAAAPVVESAGISFTRAEAEGNDVAILSDGSTIVAGRFTAANGLPRGSIALVRANGELAADWTVLCDGELWGDGFGLCNIRQVELGNDGWVYFSGGFSRINGLPRRGLARVRLSDASLDEEWNPIQAQSPRPENFILHETGIIADGRKYSLSGTGVQLSEFNPDPHLSIILSGDNLLAVRNNFQTQRLERIDPITGAADPSWSAGIEVNQWVSWARHSDYVVGYFAPTPDQPGRLVLVDSTTSPGLRPSWTLPLGLGLSWDNSFGLDGLLHGVRYSDPDQPGAPRFLTSVSLGETAEIVREAMLPDTPTCSPTLLGVDATGSAILSTAPCYSPTTQWSPDGSNIGRILPGGAIDQAWRSGIQNFGLIYAAERGPDGSIVVAGSFDRVNGTPRPGLARLTADLQLDEWDPQVEGHRFRAATIDSQGDVYAAAGPQSFEPAGFFRISGLTGIIDSAWNPSGVAGPSNAEISQLVFDRENSSLYVSFRYSGFQICGAARTGLAKVSASSPCQADPAFQPNPSAPPKSILLEQGKLYVTGEFDRIGNQPLASTARFLASGQLDLMWQPFGSEPWPAPFVTGLTATSRGIVLGGAFNAVRGTPRPGLALVDTDAGTLDTEWSNLGDWAFGLKVGRLGEDVLVTRLDSNSAGRFGRLSLVPIAFDGGSDPSWPDLDIGAMLEDGFNIVFVTLDENTTLALGNFTRLGDTPTGNAAKLHRVAPQVFRDGFEQR